MSFQDDFNSFLSSYDSLLSGNDHCRSALNRFRPALNHCRLLLNVEPNATIKYQPTMGRLRANNFRKQAGNDEKT
jgi:hypothetical protein